MCNYEDLLILNSQDMILHLQSNSQEFTLHLNSQEIISNLVIPIILTIFTSAIGSIRLHYLILKEKNRYINLLKINNPSVEAVIDTIKKFKRISQIYFVYILLFGLFLGMSYPLLFMIYSVPKYIDKFFVKYIYLTNHSSVYIFYYTTFVFVLLPSLINLLVYLVCCKLIKSKHPLTENDNDFCKLKGSQILSYFSYWLSVGFILGPYGLGLILFYSLITDQTSVLLFRWTSNDKFALIFTIVISLLVMFLSLNILFNLLKKIKQFPKNVIDPIINYHQCNFPSLKIKTDSEEFKGQLKDFQNKYLVTLFEEGILHFVSWDKIDTMEVIDINKSKCTVHAESKKKSINVKPVVGKLILFAFLVGLCIIYLANSSFNEINALIDSGRYEDALQASNKAIEIDQNNSDYYNLKGIALDDLGRANEALQAYDKAIAIEPNFAIYYSNKGIALNNLKRYDEALQACDKAIAIDPPNSANAWNGKGNALYGLGRYDEALQACDKAIAIDPNFAGYYDNKGIALNNLKRYDEALQACDKAIVIDPNDAEAWNIKGLALNNLKRYDEALQAYDKAIAINPNSAAYYDNKGLALNNLKRYDEALQAYDKAIAIDPNSAEYYVDKGNALYGLGRYDEALQTCDKAIAIDPNSAAYYSNKGIALNNLKRYDEALQACDKAIAINPNFANAWNGKGNALYGLGRYDEALQAYDKAIAIDPNSAVYYSNKGLALNNLKRYDEALQAYDKAIAIDPNFANAWNGKGLVLRKLGRYNEALQTNITATELKKK